jgi:hypothetical protein
MTAFISRAMTIQNCTKGAAKGPYRRMPATEGRSRNS